jgi:hypothetical protein
MLVDGVEVTARPAGEDTATEPSCSDSEMMDLWKRVLLAPGLELHIDSKFRKVDREKFKSISTLMKSILMNQGL